MTPPYVMPACENQDTAVSGLHTFSITLSGATAQLLKFPQHGWLNDVYSFVEANDMPEAINTLYRNVDRSFRQGQFSEIDFLLGQIDLDKLSPELWAALLTITCAAKSKLGNRPHLYAEICRRIQRLGENPDEVLRGLA